MAFDSKEFKRKVKMELSTRNGGNLRNKVNKIPQDQITIFIGLGGLGCRTVNAIKGVAEQKLDNSDRRFFLVVDTDKRALSDISESTVENLTSEAQHGWMTEDEKCSLFNEMNSYTVSTLPHDIDDWVNRAEMDTEVISGQGAHAVRQIGRIMLFSKGNYEAVYEKIANVVEKAVAQRNSLPGSLQNGKIKVYIVAGISGGTGSGTVVDISYMVRKILNQYTMATFGVEGVLFTPDVQENDKNMKDADRLKNKRNFYAAIKEIDYFYHNRTRKKAYVCPNKGADPAYEYDIFDSCTIISRFSNGRVMSDNSNGVVDKVANAIVYEISSVKAANTGDANPAIMPLSSYMDNEPTLVTNWLSTPAGRVMRIPEWAPPRYSTLGYGSFYIPRDELLAYCANKLMKELMNTWNKNVLDAKASQKFMMKYGIGSLRGFAARLFEYAEASQLFELPHKNMPRDPDSRGILKVKNCCNYINDMKNIANDEGQEVKVKQLIRDAALKTDGGIVNPICAHFDKAFLNKIPNTGPAYAVRLLSSIDPSNPGVLANLDQMLKHIQDEVESWEADLLITYNALYKLGEELETKSFVDKSELEEFTVQCRDYGEKLLQAKMLRYSYNVLFDVYDKINKKNNELFNIYTVTLEYLVEMLQGDSDYVTNPQRCRDGNNTVFSFDIVNFEDGDLTTKKFVDLFECLVDNMDISQKAEDFVNDVFANIKSCLEISMVTAKQFTEDDVLDAIRKYFANTFGLWANDVIERFCIIAYSQLDIKPEDLTDIWNDPTKTAARNAALVNTAQTIQLQLSNAAGVLLSSSDSTKDIEKFNGYTALLGIPQTKNINNSIPGISLIQSSWSEFVLFKRRAGIPLCIINGLEECQKIYSEQAVPGMHLDEVGDDWKSNLPEPYGYNIRNLMNKYINSGADQVEKDKERMSEILKLSKTAKDLGLLTLSQNSQNAGSTVAYYNMYYSFIANIDVDAMKAEIAQNLKKTVLEKIAANKELDMMGCLVDSGYQLKAPVEIRWTYTQSQLNSLMSDNITFGDDINYGNFITLIRSNYEWYEKLKTAVETFGKINNIYQEVLAEIEKESSFEKGIITLVDAIKVNRFTPFYINNVVSGFEIKIDTDSSRYIHFINEGFKAIDNYFILYLAYVECFMKLNDFERKSLSDLMSVDFSMDKHADWSRAARNNVDWFIDATDKILTDDEMLNHLSKSLLIEKMEVLLKHTDFKYSLPEASDNNKNIEVVISNLKYFYRELRETLKANRIADSVPFNDDHGSVATSVPVSEIASVPVPASSCVTWTCPTCGKANDDNINFCPVDGTKKPEPIKGWICPTCGKVNDDIVNFCPVDGTRKPESTKGWICPTCGKANDDDVNFCPVDGTRKLEQKSTWYCPKCGKENDATVNFCPVDGTKKG